MSDFQMGMVVIVAALAVVGIVGVVVYAIHRDHSANVRTCWGGLRTSPKDKNHLKSGKRIVKRRPRVANQSKTDESSAGK